MKRDQFIKTLFRLALVLILFAIAWITGRKGAYSKDCLSCPVSPGCPGLTACSINTGK